MNSDLLIDKDATKIHKFDSYVIFLRKDGITQIQFEKGFHGEEEDARNMVQIFKKINGSKKCLMLAIYEEDNLFSKEAREYIASDDVSEVVAADAFVIKGLALRIIGNGYLKINKPKRPSKLFNSEVLAVEWLKQYL